MKVVVTGAAGFIGSQIARSLIHHNHQVLALVLPNESIYRLKEIERQITLITGDLSALTTLIPKLEEWKPESCIHLAWYAEPGKYLNSYKNVQSLTNSISLLKCLIQIGCQNVVMAGSCAEYDTDLGYLRESSLTNPTTIYAATKLSMNLIGTQMAQMSKINFAWARLFYLYGPFENPQRVIPALLLALLKGKPFPATMGNQTRDYLHVEDVATAFLKLMESHANGVFNVSSGVPVTMRHLMETLGDLLGRKELIQFGALPYRDWEPMFICGDNKKLRESTDWRPKYTYHNDGLTNIIQWWKKNVEASNL